MSDRSTLLATAPGIFRYPGGKTKPAVRQWILAHKPHSVGEYREPFVGGGGVFWGMKDARRFWVNDVNPGLIAVYEALAERPAEFIARCRETKPARPGEPETEAGPRGGLPTNARLKAVFDGVALNTECDQAFRFFFVNRTVFGGRVNYGIPSRLYFSNQNGWNIVETDDLERAAVKLRGVRVTCGSYQRLLAEPGENVWVYCDPPYVVNTGLTSSSQLYQYGFTEADHKRFAAAVKASPHKVAVSYDDDPGGFVRSLFPAKDGFRIVENDWAYCGTTNAEKEQGRELLILNYAPPKTLLSFLPVEPGAEDLSEPDLDALADLEPAIERYRRAFVDAGNALRTIRDRRLYRSDFKTFEEYCEKRWGFGHNYADKMIRSAEVVKELGTFVPKPPAIESHARELLVIPTVEQRAEVWTAVVADSESTGSPITAKLVRQHVEAALPPDIEPLPDWTAKFLNWWGKVPEGEHEPVKKFILKTLTGKRHD